MRKYSVLTLIIIIVITSATYSQSSENQLNLMPWPKELKLIDGKFRIDTNFLVGLKGDGDKRIFAASTKMLRRLDARTGLFFKQDFITPENNPDSANLTIICAEPGVVKLGADESYVINIDSLKIEIIAPNDLGAMHGMETLLQLLNVDEKGYFFPAINIIDEPRFPWRGLMIDACRHFMPVDVIKRNLDAMAAVKLNVFHWHLSEDQGFRVESKLYPKLQELGSDGLYYTQEEIKNIVQYASDRGIRVVPEFDVPGHATSWFAAYPEFASAPGPYKIERKWGVFDPTFDPTQKATYKFLGGVFGEMKNLFPDEYFHIGGDENNGKQWNENESIQKFMKEKNIKDNHELQAFFNNNLLKILTLLDKKMVGWDEILHEQMPKDIVIQSWRGKDAMIKAAKEGYKSILSNGYYIDLVQHTDVHYLNDPLPADSPLTFEERKRILGGEATMWAELITPETIDSRIWPRTAAIAERFWSPGNITDVKNMFHRLDRISFLLEEHGLLHLKNYEMMLRRLTNNNDIAPLKVLVDVLEPLKGYSRHSGAEYRQQSPYTRVVDAARPDSKVGREFENIIEEYMSTKNPETLDALKSKLIVWQNNHNKLAPIINLSPVLKEIERISLNLSNLSQVGIEALNLLRDGNKAPVKWIEKSRALLEEAKKPYGQTEIRVTKAIETLVFSVTE